MQLWFRKSSSISLILLFHYHLLQGILAIGSFGNHNLKSHLMDCRFLDEQAGQIPIAFVVRKRWSIIDESQIQDFIAKQVPHAILVLSSSEQKTVFCLTDFYHLLHFFLLVGCSV